MGSKSAGGGRSGFGDAKQKGPRSKGPKNLGGRSGAGGAVTGGGTEATLARVGKQVSLANFARQAGLGHTAALAEVDSLVASGRATYTFLGDGAAGVLRAHGRAVPVRGGRPVGGFTVT